MILGFDNTDKNGRIEDTPIKSIILDIKNNIKIPNIEDLFFLSNIFQRFEILLIIN